jgi:hypothetical protein
MLLVLQTSQNQGNGMLHTTYSLAQRHTSSGCTFSASAPLKPELT